MRGKKWLLQRGRLFMLMIQMAIVMIAYGLPFSRSPPMSDMKSVLKDHQIITLQAFPVRQRSWNGILAQLWRKQDNSHDGTAFDPFLVAYLQLWPHAGRNQTHNRQDHLTCVVGSDSFSLPRDYWTYYVMVSHAFRSYWLLCIFPHVVNLPLSYAVIPQCLRKDMFWPLA